MGPSDIFHFKHFCKVLVASFSIVIALARCKTEKPIEANTFRGEAQGTTYTVTYIGKQKNLQLGVDSIFQKFDLDLSLWVENSLINQFNRFNRIDTVFAFYDSTKYLSVTYEIARQIYKETNGAFDPTVGPLVNLWGFGLSRRGEVNSDSVAALLPLVGFSHQNCDLIELTEEYVYQESWLSKGQPGVQLDFNGIAQGVAVDFIAEYMWNSGLNDFMVELGGEVFCSGLNPEGKPWQIGVEKPLENGDREIETVVGISNAGLATSGSYRRFYEENGHKFSHTIDPKTGRPVTHSLLSATVVSVGAGQADAYATALMVMGPDSAQAFLREPPSDLKAAYLIWSEGDTNRDFMTESFKALITEKGN